jgi:hypothetical protein
MHSIFYSTFLSYAATLSLMAGTVLITSVPDSEHRLESLTSLDGISLAGDTQVLVGAFPGLSDDQVLDLASQGGLAQISSTFVSFGDPCAIGQGVDGEVGGFEISVRDTDATSTAVDEIVSLLIQTPGGEFLVARFDGNVFESETDTGLEPLLSLHLAEAKIIVGNRLGTAKFATSTAPAVGSFSTWLAGFSSITDPSMKLPGADPDFDSRSNFLEYATGGNPESGEDQQPCRIQPDGEGGMWVHFNRVPGLGSIDYSLETSDSIADSWLETEGSVEPDPEIPATMRLHLLPPFEAPNFFRLKVESAP